MVAQILVSLDLGDGLFPIGTKAIAYANAGVSLIGLCGIHMRRISYWVFTWKQYPIECPIYYSIYWVSRKWVKKYLNSVYFYTIYCHVGMNYSYCIGQCCWYYTVFEMLHKHLTCLTLFTNIMLIICHFPGNYLVMIQIENRGIKSPPPWCWNVGDVEETFSDILWKQIVQYVAEACI